MPIKKPTRDEALVEPRNVEFRGQKVILDRDLAALYNVTTSRLNEQVSRNTQRFPDDFMFRLSAREWSSLRSQNAISNAGRGGRTHLPRAFTEHGVAMLSSVLKSERAVQVNIAIVRAFVRLRAPSGSHSDLLTRLNARETTVGAQGAQIGAVFQAVRRLLEEDPSAEKRRIGFEIED